MMNRTSSAIRLHLINPRATLGIPLLAVGCAFVIVLVSGLAMNLKADAGELESMNQGMIWNGAIWALWGPLLGIASVGMRQALDLALGLGLTRREYLSATAVVFAGISAGVAGLVTVLKVIEGLTDGWFLRVRMFDTVWTGVGEWWRTGLQTLLIMLALFTLTATISGILRRWGRRGTAALTVGGILVGATLFALLIVPTPVGVALAGALTWSWVAWMAVLATLAVALGAAALALIRRAEVA